MTNLNNDFISYLFIEVWHSSPCLHLTVGQIRSWTVLPTMKHPFRTGTYLRLSKCVFLIACFLNALLFREPTFNYMYFKCNLNKTDYWSVYDVKCMMLCLACCHCGGIVSNLSSTIGCWTLADLFASDWGVNVHPYKGRTQQVCFMTQ